MMITAPLASRFFVSTVRSHHSCFLSPGGSFLFLHSLFLVCCLGLLVLFRIGLGITRIGSLFLCFSLILPGFEILNSFIFPLRLLELLFCFHTLFCSFLLGVVFVSALLILVNCCGSPFLIFHSILNSLEYYCSFCLVLLLCIFIGFVFFLSLMITVSIGFRILKLTITYSNSSFHTFLILLFNHLF